MKILIPIIYFILFPTAGCGIGYLFFLLYGLIGNQLDNVDLEIFVFVWGMFGLFAGIYGYRMHLKISKNYQNIIDTQGSNDD